MVLPRNWKQGFDVLCVIFNEILMALLWPINVHPLRWNKEMKNLSKGVETRMKIVCAWCGRELGEKDGRGIEGVSHGLCNKCLARLQEEAENGLSTESKPIDDAQNK